MASADETPELKGPRPDSDAEPDPAENKDLDERYVANALVRGLQIIRCFDHDHPTLSLVQIADMLGVGRSVPYRLVYTLERLGYLVQDKQTKRYRLTPKVMELGYSYLQSMHVPEVADPILQELRDVTGCSAHLGVLWQHSVVYIARAAARTVTSVGIHVGARLPAHATAMGKVLLAYQPEPVLEEWFSREERLPYYTTNTKVFIQELLLEIKKIREQGYALSNEEFEYGVRSVAMAVLDRDGRAVAAMNVAAMPSAMDDEFIREVVLPSLRSAVERLTAFFAYGGKAQIVL